MTYKFEQFNTEIIDPTVIADMDTIMLNVTNTTISVKVTLETANAKLYGVQLKDVVVANLSFQGYENLMIRVMTNLEQYEV